MLFAHIISYIINFYIIIIITHVAVSWLITFKVLDTTNPRAQNLVDLLKRLTDPVMKPVQKYVPPIGGIDLTPIVVIIGLQVLNTLIFKLFVSMLY
jgi:YggT family protein